MNNFEKIKAMNVDEMAEFINNSVERCDLVCNSKDCAFHRKCIDGIKQWLQQESEG